MICFDSEISRINIPRDSDPFLPVLPSPEIAEEPLEDGLDTPPVTPLHSPLAFLKEKRWLLSPPPIVSTLSTHSEVKPPSDAPDKTESGQNSTPHVTVRGKKSKASRRRATYPMSLPLQSEEHPPRKRIRSNTVAAHLDCSTQDTSNPSIPTGNEHSGKSSVHPILLVRPVTLPVGTGPTIWHPSSLLQILSHPTPDLVRWLTTAWMPYMCPPACQIPRKYLAYYYLSCLESWYLYE